MSNEATDETGGYVGFPVEGRTDTPFWSIHGLWKHAADLPVLYLPLSQFTPVLDEEQAWFAGQNPTLREIAQQARRIYEADLSFPIILSAHGNLMDGKHRLAQAFLKNLETIAAVQFVEMPEPDFWHEINRPAELKKPSVEENAPPADGFVIIVDGVVVDSRP